MGHPRFDIAEVRVSPNKTGRTEREHMVGWFRANETTGSGHYSRNEPNRSARLCYNRLLNAASLLWIAEAVGVEQLTVKQAYEKQWLLAIIEALAVPLERSSPGT